GIFRGSLRRFLHPSSRKGSLLRPLHRGLAHRPATQRTLADLLCGDPDPPFPARPDLRLRRPPSLSLVRQTRKLQPPQDGMARTFPPELKQKAGTLAHAGGKK